MLPTDELILVNYGSTDGLVGWLSTQVFNKDVKLVTYNGNTDRFHLTKAKNIAHFHANREILCNLDVDNWIYDGFSDWLFGNVNESTIVRGELTSAGARGRVAMFTSTFRLLGGYNENFYGWGYDVTDLMIRATDANIATKFIPSNWLSHITHGDDLRELADAKSLSASCNANIKISTDGKFSGIQLKYNSSIRSLSK